MDVSKPCLYLCKPNRETIADLSEQSYNITRNLKLGNISELNFTLPLFIEKDHELIQNKNINLIRFKYLIKFQIDNKIEWYIIKNPISDMKEDTDEFLVECFSLPYLLSNYLIRSYSVESKTLSQIADDLLKETNWSLGYVNASFDTKYRAFEVSSDTVLSSIFNLATTFGAIIKWDTENKEISFYKSEQIGKYNGLNLDYGKYLKSLNQSLNTEDFCTRLKIFGRDGLGINKYNITGSNYLDNFGYFLYPYSEDSSGNVIQSSNYMSNSLCHAILEYNKLLQEKDGEFNGYLNQLDIYNGELLTLNGNLITLQEELSVILDNLDIAQSKGENVSNLLAQKSAKETEIDNKNTEITNKQNQINSIQSNITTLGNSLSMESNFTPEEITQLTDYVVEKTVENEYIFDAKELLDWGKEQFLKICTPQVLIDVNTLNIDQYLDEDCQLDKGKLVLGDIVKINHELFRIGVMAKIVEMTINYEDAEIDLVISNIEQINKEEDIFLKKWNQTVSTSTTVNMDRFKWNGAVVTANDVSQILSNVWNATERNINSGVNNSVVVDRRGITVTSIDDVNKIVRIVAGCIGVSNTGGNVYHQAITGDGIYGERIISQIIASNNLIITNSNGSFLVNETGVTLDGLSLQITGKLPDSQIASASTWNNSLQQNTLYNGIIINSTNGMVITRSDNKVKIISNATEGISIEKWENSQWVKKLYADTNGDLIVNGLYTGNINANQINSGILTIGSGVTIQGTLNTSDVNISGTLNINNMPLSSIINSTINDINGSSNIINGSSIQGATITNLNANNITAGKLKANYIDVVGLSAQYIVDTNNPSNKMYFRSASNGFELLATDSNNNYFSIDTYYGYLNMAYKDSHFLHADLTSTKPIGVWNFKDATIQNLNITAKFG